MSMPLLIEDAVQWLLRLQAFATLQQIEGGPRAIYKSCDSPDGGNLGSQTKKILPYVLIECVSCDPWPTSRKAKKRLATVRITVKSQRDDENEHSHASRCEEVFGFIQDTDFKSLLNTYPNPGVNYPNPGFTAIDIRFGPDTLSKVDRTLESSIDLIVIFAAGQLT